jgi:hypothetical protein
MNDAIHDRSPGSVRARQRRSVQIQDLRIGVTIDAMSFNTFERLERLGLFYVRYMDDIAVLAPTRWTLRRAVKVLNQTFAALRLEKQPGKTYIGRIERGFDFLRYHMQPEGLTVASATLARFVARATQLYEREPGAVSHRSRLGLYVKRWCSWARAGGITTGPPFANACLGLGQAAPARACRRRASPSCEFAT